MNAQLVGSGTDVGGVRAERWNGKVPSTRLGWAALLLVAAHGFVLLLASVFDPGYWRAEDLWTTQAVVTATAFAISALAGAVSALVATLRYRERSLLMLVPLVLGSFWLYWLVAEAPGWLQ